MSSVDSSSQAACEVSLITRDAFEPSLPLSVAVHIDNGADSPLKASGDF